MFEPFKNAPFNIHDSATLALFMQIVSNAERVDTNKPSLETAVSGRSNSTRAKITSSLLVLLIRKSELLTPLLPKYASLNVTETVFHCPLFLHVMLTEGLLLLSCASYTSCHLP